MKRAAFVTGGASGIGLSICQHLARAGHSVAVADYNGDGAEEAAKAIRDGGGRAVAVPGRRQRPVPDRQGGRGRPRRVRADRDPGDQCRRVPPGAVRADERGVVGADHQRQPDRHVPLRAGGDRGHDRRGVGPGGDDLLVERAARRLGNDPLRGLQGWRDRVRQVARARVRRARASRSTTSRLGGGNADGGAAAGGRQGAVERGDGPRACPSAAWAPATISPPPACTWSPRRPPMSRARP